MDKNTQIQREAFDDYRAYIGYARYRKTFDILKTMKPGKVLEIGSCGGEFLELLKKHSWKVKGLEISKKASERAKKRGIPSEIHDANLKLPEKDNTYDAVIAGEIIEHVYDDVGFLDEIHRVLKKSGKVVVTTPNLLSFKNRILMLFGRDARYALSHVHYHVYTKSFIKRTFRLSKFGRVKLNGNYILFSKNRNRFFGSIFEKLAQNWPNMSEHFIASSVKR